MKTLQRSLIVLAALFAAASMSPAAALSIDCPDGHKVPPNFNAYGVGTDDTMVWGMCFHPDNPQATVAGVTQKQPANWHIVFIDANLAVKTGYKLRVECPLTREVVDSIFDVEAQANDCQALGGGGGCSKPGKAAPKPLASGKVRITIDTVTPVEGKKLRVSGTVTPKRHPVYALFSPLKTVAGKPTARVAPFNSFGPGNKYDITVDTTGLANGKYRVCVRSFQFGLDKAEKDIDFANIAPVVEMGALRWWEGDLAAFPLFVRLRELSMIRTRG